MFGKIKKYLDGVVLEMKKVTWLNKDELVSSSIIVGVFAVIMSIFLFVLDWSITEVMARLLGGK